MGGVIVDNCWIVPHLPFLCGEFNCHINMECAISLGTFKYAFKYIQKGPDLAAMEVNRCNEVKWWIQGCYISPPDAVWQIFHFDIQEKILNVVCLQVHLENHHMVTFNPNEDIDTVLQCGENQRTSLTAFFEANTDPGPLGEEARKHTYQEFPLYLTLPLVFPPESGGLLDSHCSPGKVQHSGCSPGGIW